MPRLSDTLARLAALQKTGAMAHMPSRTVSPLNRLEPWTNNPGALEAYSFVPSGPAPGKPLVVVLHGCTQSAEAYEQGAAWTELAERHGFALLYPQQVRANNANLCFNWFEPGDTKRTGGEAESIASMIEHMILRHDIDRTRVFITGLSAGGAMTSVMLARFPELFAGGAIIAGLAFGMATTVASALDRMRGKGIPSPAALATHIRSASSHEGPWPRISVWQGLADHVVVPSNARAIVDQWLPQHHLDAQASQADMIDGHRRERWMGSDGLPIVELHSIEGLGHGTPIDSHGSDPLGKPGPHMLEADTSSTRRIAQFWGLAPVTLEQPRARKPQSPTVAQPFDVQAIIDAALRRAGIRK